MFIPFLAPGHMLPMVDIARLFAATPTPEINFKLFHGIKLLEPEMAKLIRTHHPHCLASDILYPWSADVASELGIPRLAFSGSGFFNLCVADIIESKKPHAQIESETEEFVVPGIPDQVKLTRSQLPDTVKGKTKFSEFFEILKRAERKSYGVLVNSFEGLESDYADHYRNASGLKAWKLGPVSLFINRDFEDKIDRGGKASVTGDTFLNWLDSKKPNSVLYVCLGMEELNHPFIWVVAKILKGNEIDDDEREQEWWLPEGFEERAKQSGKGVIIKGWAPQMVILEHNSIGGAGLPMVTWPIFAEQFYNEKLVSQVLKFGVSVGNEVWSVWATEESTLISAKRIKSAVEVVMGDGVEAVGMRKTVGRLAEMAKKAVERGGSSDRDLKRVLDDIREYKERKDDMQK
ncbi:Scopoletin glucosyltransferase [Linum perenne]